MPLLETVGHPVAINPDSKLANIARKNGWRDVRLESRGFVGVGDIARTLGSVRVARQVGYALAAIPDGARDVPWFRVVNARGILHRDLDTPEGEEQRRRLRREGIEVDDGGRIVDFATRRFRFAAAEDSGPH